MTATLNLNLGEALTADELRALTQAATERDTTIERILYEAAHALYLSSTRQLALPFNRNPQPAGKGVKA